MSVSACGLVGLCCAACGGRRASINPFPATGDGRTPPTRHFHSSTVYLTTPTDSVSIKYIYAQHHPAVVLCRFCDRVLGRVNQASLFYTFAVRDHHPFEGLLFPEGATARAAAERRTRYPRLILARSLIIFISFARSLIHEISHSRDHNGRHRRHHEAPLFEDCPQLQCISPLPHPPVAIVGREPLGAVATR